MLHCFFMDHHIYLLYILNKSRYSCLNVYCLSFPCNKNCHCCSNFRRPIFQEVNPCIEFPPTKLLALFLQCFLQKYIDKDFVSQRSLGPLRVAIISCVALAIEGLEPIWSPFIFLRKQSRNENGVITLFEIPRSW